MAADNRTITIRLNTLNARKGITTDDVGRRVGRD